MIVGVPTERAPGEHRVALTPDAVQRLAQRDLTVLLEPGAGAGASLLDDAYREAGAEIASSVEDVYARADIVVRIGRVEPAEVAALRSGTVLVGYLRPLTDPELVQALTSAGVTGFSMEAVPRVTRAQRMDSLSSQATVSGYRAVILAAEALPKFYPMLMTAAGTAPPGSRRSRPRAASAPSSRRSTRAPPSRSRCRASARRSSSSRWRWARLRTRAATPPCSRRASWRSSSACSSATSPTPTSSSRRPSCR